MMYAAPMNPVMNGAYQDPNKVTVPLDTFTYRYNTSFMYPEFFGPGLEICKQLIEKIEKECDYYKPFLNFQKYMKCLPFVFLILVPIVFGLSVLGGTTQNFSLVYLSAGIFFVFIITNLIINIYMSSRFEAQMQSYNEKSNSIVSKYNNEHLHAYNLRAQYRYEMKYVYGYRRARRQIDLYIDFIKLNSHMIGQPMMMPQNIPMGAMSGYPVQGQPGQYYPNQGYNPGYQGQAFNGNNQVNYGGVYGPAQNI